ncbi:MarR family transcriptional regulator, partial [Bacillus cereus]|nr:MarR family transcriptional regulator [Bacillus cereus]
PGITQKELCDKLSIAPSTSTRFINKLEGLNLVSRRPEWKETHIHLTDEGVQLCEKIDTCFEKLTKEYMGILGEENSLSLTKALHDSSEL